MSDRNHATPERLGGRDLPASRSECPPAGQACPHTTCRVHLQGATATARNQHGPRHLPVVDEARPSCVLALPAGRRSIADVAALVDRDDSVVYRSLARARAALDARDPETTSPIEAIANLRPLDEIVARLRFGLGGDADSYQPRFAADRTAK